MSALSEEDFRKLKGIYTSLTEPAAFGRLCFSITFSEFKLVTRKFKQLKARSLGISQIWSMDVAIMEKFTSQNSGSRYLLIVIDVLSRFVRVQQTKSKHSTTV